MIEKEIIQKMIESTLQKSVIIKDLLRVKSNVLVIDNETINDITKNEKNYPYDISIMVLDKDNKILFKCTFFVVKRGNPSSKSYLAWYPK